MSTTNIQTVNQETIYYLKIIQHLERRLHVRPIFNKNGTFSFKRHNINNQNDLQYLYSKCLKKIKVRTREQLNLLMNTYSNELFNVVIDIKTELKHVPSKQIMSHSTYVSVMKELEPIFVNYREKREQSIIDHGIITTSILKDLINQYTFYGRDYGRIDYYHGVILLFNLNINATIPLLKQNSIKYFRTTNIGLYPLIRREENNKEYLEIYDFKHKSTMFTFWQPENNNRIARLYYFIGNKKTYISLVVDKIQSQFVQCNTKTKLPKKRIINKY